MVKLIHRVSASLFLRRLPPSCLRSRAPARSEEADAEGTSTDADQEAHELLVSVLWVFFGLSTVAGLLSCYIKGQKAEREQGLRDKAAESRAMTYVVRALTPCRATAKPSHGWHRCLQEHGRADHPEIWQLQPTLGLQGRECWMRDTVDAAADGESGAPSGEEQSTAGELLWADQLHLHKRYGDEVHIALVDQQKE